MNDKELLEKICSVIENDEELAKYGKIEDATKEVLRKMHAGEIFYDDAAAILAEKNKFLGK